MMTILEIIQLIEAAEKLIPAVASFVNTIHPPTTSAPTRAAVVLGMTQNALNVAGFAASSIASLAPSLTAAANAGNGTVAELPTSAIVTVQSNSAAA